MWSADIMVEIKAINKSHIDDVDVSGVFDNEEINTQLPAYHQASTIKESNSDHQDSTSSHNSSLNNQESVLNLDSVIKNNHKLCTVNKERGRPTKSTVNKVIGLKKKKENLLPPPSQSAVISDTIVDTSSLIKIGKRKANNFKTSEVQSKPKKSRLTIKLRDEISVILNHILIDNSFIDNIINKQLLIDEQHVKVIADFPQHVFDLYEAIQAKYDFMQFFTDDGFLQFKSLFK